MQIWDGRLTLQNADEPIPLWAGRNPEYEGEQPAMADADLVVTADEANTGVIVLGNRQVIATAATRTGRPLKGGEQARIPTPHCLKCIYAAATVAGEGLAISYYSMTGIPEVDNRIANVFTGLGATP